MDGGPSVADADLLLFGLEADPGQLDASLALLSPDERQRADRFRFPDDRRRFAVARATLRRVLGEVLGRDPKALEFDYGAQGKPALAQPPAGVPLSFNASHSGERLLVGLVRGGEIGVDIERHRSTVDRDGLVRRYFSVAENACYFGLPDAERDQAFFDCWTRKEALVKALGRGLTFPLKDFDVGFAQGADGLLRLQDLHGDAIGWCVGGCTPEPGYSAAFALRGCGCRLID